MSKVLVNKNSLILSNIMPKNPKMGKRGFERPENALKVPTVPQSGTSRTTKSCNINNNITLSLLELLT